VTARQRVGGVTLAAVLGVAGIAPGCAPESRAMHHEVEIRALAFEPATLAVAPGDTVTWINRDIVPHTVTGAGELWDSGELAPDGRFTWVVVADSGVGYDCRYHPMMTGALTVDQ
jgi:plastocyanin